MNRSAHDSPHSKDLLIILQNKPKNKQEQLVSEPQWQNCLVCFKSKGCCQVHSVSMSNCTIFCLILVNEFPPKKDEKPTFPFLFLQILKYQLTQLTKRPTSAFEVMWLKTTCFLVIKLCYLCLCERESMNPMQSVHKGLCFLLIDSHTARPD